MAQDKKRLDKLLHKFMDRSADPDEASVLWQWLWQLDIPEQEATVDNGQQERLWQAISSQTIDITPRRKRFRSWRLAAAAVLPLSIAALGGWWWMCRKQPVEQYVITSDSQHLKSIILPDGTTVHLNLSSSLTYTSDYNKATRRVILQGEGYFNVAGNDEQPFIVESAGLETQVLGTSFNIEAHKGAAQIRIAVTSGKIAVYQLQHPQQRRVVEPGQILRFEPATGTMLTNTFSNNVTAWTTGGFAFNGIPLSEALQKIAVHYQLQIRYHSQQPDLKTVTASLGKNSWQKVLSAVLFPHNLTYKVKDGIVIIQ